MPTLSWLTREKDVKSADAVAYRLLERDDALSFGDPASGNMLIQGDNLEALKSLLPYYRGQVKCIYIDPPYNTRSAFEHYDDNLEHSQWLAMIWPRLVLLRELLAEDGSIWVSIDDNEGPYLKVVMDEVFYRRNFITSFIWQKVDSPNENQSKITPDHEYIHVYGNERAMASFERKSDESLLDAYPQRTPEGRRYRDRLLKKNGKASLRTDRPSMFFEIVGPDGVPVLPIHDDGREARWSLGKDTVDALVAANALIWKQRERQGQTVWVPYTREYAPDNPVRPHSTILLDVKTSRQAKAHQRELLPGVEVFDTVKPEQLLERILTIATKPGDLVLDSFLGSGTTAAVAQKLGRRWIGVEMGDHAVSHCAPRLRKVIEGEQGGISQAVSWQGGGGFAFYRLGEAVFDADGAINPVVTFAPLAAHIWFSETGQPMTCVHTGPFLGSYDGQGYALLYNGILGDKSVSGGNVLTRKTLGMIRSSAGEFAGPMTVYGEASRLSPETLKAEGILFKQTPYDVRAR